MTREQHDGSYDDDSRFDLLVDGELGESERRDLLAGLDDEPGGWRRCALAFLEAQSWRHELPTVLREPSLAAEGSATIVLPTKSSPARKFLSRIALAASFLVAFSVGLMMRGGWNVPGFDLDPGNQVVVDEPDRGSEDSSSQETALAVGDANSPTRPSDENPDSPPSFNPGLATPAVVQGGDQIPPQVLQALKRMGYDVQQSREVWTIEAEGGHRGFVPVDKTDIRFVGDWYQ